MLFFFFFTFSYGLGPLILAFHENFNEIGKVDFEKLPQGPDAKHTYSEETLRLVRRLYNGPTHLYTTYMRESENNASKPKHRFL